MLARVNQLRPLRPLGPVQPDWRGPRGRREWLLLHLSANAAEWQAIAGEVDASSFDLLGRLEAVSRALAELQRTALEPHGINYAEFTTLGMLRTTRPDLRRSPTELRRLVGQSSAGMTRILRKLERTRLVRRVSAREDGRRRDVVLTAKGAALVEAAFPALFSAPSERLARRTKRERDAWTRALDELLEFLAPGEEP
jgi:DNA-binding MarR family transcriptional regulator